MPSRKAQPPPKPELPPNQVQVAGTQEQFQAKGFALATALGWEGEPGWVIDGISVEDAQNYCVKMLHEHFQAGARGDAQPSYEAACKHLAVDNAAEKAAVEVALKEAFESGKGALVSTVEKKVVPVGADLIYDPKDKPARGAGKVG